LYWIPIFPAVINRRLYSLESKKYAGKNTLILLRLIKRISTFVRIFVLMKVILPRELNK
jgi:hypothetical protein